MNVTIKKSELLEKLIANRATHRKVFEEALEGYRKELLAHLERMIERVRVNRRVDTLISLVQPSDQTADYDAAIAMFKMSVDETVKLDSKDFRCYVLDQWGWRDSFLHSNAGYSATARAILHD